MKKDVMRNKKRCPECNQWLISYESDCDCGWQAKKCESMINNHCQYQVNFQACPLPGSISSALYGNRIWHCTQHHRYLDNPKRSYEIWQDAITNFEAIMEDYIDWRVKLIPAEYQIAKEKIKKLAQQLKFKGEIK